MHSIAFISILSYQYREETQKVPRNRPLLYNPPTPLALHPLSHGIECMHTRIHHFPSFFETPKRKRPAACPYVLLSHKGGFSRHGKTRTGEKQEGKRHAMQSNDHDVQKPSNPSITPYPSPLASDPERTTSGEVGSREPKPPISYSWRSFLRASIQSFLARHQGTSITASHPPPHPHLPSAPSPP